MHAAGLSLRKIAGQMRLSHTSIRKVLASPAPPPVELPPAQAVADDDAPDDNAPALQQAQYLLAQARADLRRAQAVGDSQLAQRQTRNCAALMTVLARLEREQSDDGSITISPGDFAAACADLEAKAKAYAERGGVIRCADCNRILSIQWGLGAPPAEPFDA